jgi:hypothetical protein
MPTEEPSALKRASSLYVAGDGESAKKLLDQLVMSDDATISLAAAHMRARGNEDGFFDGRPNLQQALTDFRALEEGGGLFSGEGRLGRARILYRMDGAKHREEVLALCASVREGQPGVKARMLAGLVYMDAGEHRRARELFLSAFFEGLPWGLRFYARSHAKERHWFRAALAHCLATVVSPFLVLKFGTRSAFR